jgi:amino acid transporter
MTNGSALFSIKRLLLGRPIPSYAALHERLSKKTGLAVLSSDALSSVAYATEEILRTLVLAGASAIWLATPIGAVIAGLLLVVAFSYRQTIFAYPSGGGAFIVAKENLGAPAGLVAAAALLIDYTLTVAVSVAAGTAAVTSAVPALQAWRLPLTLLFVALLAMGNLRGIRESGRIFAVPTYFFLVSLMLMIARGAWLAVRGEIPPPEVSDAAVATGVTTLTPFLVLRAFANGCTAMTGVEAVSNGVPAFEPPESRNAAATLLIMAGLCVTLFLGITLLARTFGIIPAHDETVISQLGRAVLGGRGLAYYLVQAATMLILVLAANTAYSDFPRLSSVVARERFLPRQFMNQGDRLAFTNGILVLSGLAALLLAIFRGDTNKLIPLYMVGVFVSFTLSQAGMVVHWRKERGRQWRLHAAVNGVGAVLTAVVMVVVAATKFHEGAWIVVVLIPILVLHFLAIRRHYAKVAQQLTLEGYVPPPRRHHIVIVPVGDLQRAVVEALRYAKTLSTDVRAIYVDVDPWATLDFHKKWEEWGQEIPLFVLSSPYRSLMEPLMGYIDEVTGGNEDTFLTVVLPEFVPAKWWHHLLHNQRALLIKGALLFRANTVVTSVPFHLRG